MSRLEAGLDRQELLLQRPASVWCDFGASLPLCLAVGLDDLAGGSREARKVLRARKKEKEEKNTKSENEPNGKRQARTKKKAAYRQPSLRSGHSR